MRKRNLEHIFKHIILFIAIILPLLIGFSALFYPSSGLDYNSITDSDLSVSFSFDTVYNSRMDYFMRSLHNFFVGAGLRPFYIDEYGSLVVCNHITYGVFDMLSYLGLDGSNFHDVEVSAGNLYGGLSATGAGYSCWGSAIIVCEYVGYIFFVYVIYFLLELFLFVPRLGVQFGEKLVGSKGDVEW